MSFGVYDILKYIFLTNFDVFMDMDVLPSLNDHVFFKVGKHIC